MKNRLSRIPQPKYTRVVQPQVGLLLGLSAEAKVYHAGHMDVYVDRDDSSGWHMVIVTKGQCPKFDEIMAMRFALLPLDIQTALILPGNPREYLDCHQVDVWQVVHADDAARAQAEAEAAHVPA